MDYIETTVITEAAIMAAKGLRIEARPHPKRPGFYVFRGSGAADLEALDRAIRQRTVEVDPWRFLEARRRILDFVKGKVNELEQGD